MRGPGEDEVRAVSRGTDSEDGGCTVGDGEGEDRARVLALPDFTTRFRDRLAVHRESACHQIAPKLQA
jgi:hypothetical protein